MRSIILDKTVPIITEMLTNLQLHSRKFVGFDTIQIDLKLHLKNIQSYNSYTPKLHVTQFQSYNSCSAPVVICFYNHPEGCYSIPCLSFLSHRDPATLRPIPQTPTTHFIYPLKPSRLHSGEGRYCRPHIPGLCGDDPKAATILHYLLVGWDKMVAAI